MEGVREDVPVIDLAIFSTSGSAERLDELQKVKKAFQEWGFFKIVNHGIDPVLLEKTLNSSVQFFNLPLEEKLKLTTSRFPFGFVNKSKTNGTDDGREHIMLYGPQSSSAEHNVWPTEPESFKRNAEDCMQEIAKLSQLLISIIFEALGIPKDFKETFDKRSSDMLIFAYYPATPADDPREHVLAPHIDSGVMAILTQLNHVSGLEMFKDEKWVPIEYKDGALVVNFGNVLQVWTNDKYMSVLHRVAKSHMDRYSCAYQISPSLDAEIAPLPEFFTSGEQPKYTPYLHGDYMKNRHANAKRN